MSSIEKRPEIDAHQLLERIRNGDPNAFEQLHAYFHPFLLSYLMRKCGNKSMAEDIAQTVWMEAWKNISHITAAKSWLLQRAEQRFIDSVRKKEHRFSSIEEHEVNPEDNSDSIYQKVATSEHAEEVRHWIGQLDSRCRELIQLKFMEQISYEELANHFDVATTTLHKRVFNCMTKLKSIARNRVVMENPS